MLGARHCQASYPVQGQVLFKPYMICLTYYISVLHDRLKAIFKIAYKISYDRYHFMYKIYNVVCILYE